MAFTYFFRDKQTLNMIVDNLVPKLAGQQNIQIWDAGCATGEEPYSLAILLAEKMGYFAFKNVKIIGTDINNDFEKIIDEATYPYSILQRIPKPIFKKYFHKTKKKDHFQLNYNIKNKVIFQINDLTRLVPIEGKNSLILCKNVLLHQKPEQRIKILKMFHQTLKPNGVLALEQTQKIPDKIKDLFVPIVKHTQIFRKNSK